MTSLNMEFVYAELNVKFSQLSARDAHSDLLNCKFWYGNELARALLRLTRVLFRLAGVQLDH